MLLRNFLLSIGLLAMAAVGEAQSLPSAPVSLNIPKQALGDALNEFARQAQLHVAFYSTESEGFTSPPLSGTYTPQDALTKLLENTSLTYSVIDARTVAVMSKEKAALKGKETAQAMREEGLRLVQEQSAASMQMARAENAQTGTSSGSSAESADQGEQDSTGIPEILVKGNRSLNSDVKRSEDAPQPYVIFDREEIQRSQAVTVDEFLKTRLPMNTTAAGNSQSTVNASTTSGINLRGLGENQTLILVDGRRMPGIARQVAPGQPDLNGIPLSAIERIEVLPSTAGGIYGGGATGGVINVILRRDFRGIEVSAAYANTFDSDVANMRIDATAGFSLEQGRTQVTITATRTEGNSLLAGDRDFQVRAIERVNENNPAAFTALTTPPLGATPNIRGVGGALLQLKPEYGGAALGKATTYIPFGYAGPQSDSGAALVANAGKYNLALPGGPLGLGRGLIAVPSMESASLNVRREFGQRVDAYLDVSTLGNDGITYYGNLPTSVTLSQYAPNNPFLQAITVSFPSPGESEPSISESSTVRVNAGLIARLPHSWSAGVDYGWSRSRFAQISTSSIIDLVGTCVMARGVAANVIYTGFTTPCAAGDSRPALNVLQEATTFPLDLGPYRAITPNQFIGPADTVLKNAALRLSGPTVHLPGGPLSLSVLLERREEVGKEVINTFLSPNDLRTNRWPERSQEVDSYYIEARAPLISRENAMIFAQGLELQASMRRDRYITTGANVLASSVPLGTPLPPVSSPVSGEVASTDYTVGLRYAPMQDLTLRASFGTGFLPPSISQLVPIVTSASFSLGNDPKRGGTPIYVGTPYVWLLGGNLDLKPEQSESLSVGLIFTPRFAPDFRLSVDYTRIDKKDEIQSPQSQFLLDHEDDFPGRIVRGANLVGDQPGWAGPVTSFDAGNINIANTSLEAYDIQADYTLATEKSGAFRWYAVATWERHYRAQSLASAPVVERVGFTGGPLEWRGNIGLDWTRGPMSVSWNAQYYHSYLVHTALALPLTPAQATQRATLALNQGSDTIPSQMYHDLIATYTFESSARFAGGLLANSSISFGIQNVFDKYPPVVASTLSYGGGYSPYGDPRLRRYSVSFRKSFGN